MRYRQSQRPLIIFSNPCDIDKANAHSSFFSNPCDIDKANAHSSFFSNPCDIDKANAHSSFFSNPCDIDKANAHSSVKWISRYAIVWFGLVSIFQIYHGSQFHWWRKPEYPENTNAHARELDVVCFLWALKYVTFSFFYTFRGTKSYKICDFIYHVMVISEIYDNLWCRNWHLMWFRKDKEQRNVRMVIVSIHYLQR